MGSASSMPSMYSQGETVRSQSSILILEENRAIEELLTWALVIEGYLPPLAANELTRRAQSERSFDLILFDLDGSSSWTKRVAPFYHLLQERWEGTSRQSGKTDVDPACVMLTCHPQKKEAVERANLPVLLKPFHIRDLLHAVNAALNQQKAALFVTRNQETLNICSSVYMARGRKHSFEDSVLRAARERETRC